MLRSPRPRRVTSAPEPAWYVVDTPPTSYLIDYPPGLLLLDGASTPRISRIGAYYSNASGANLSVTFEIWRLNAGGNSTDRVLRVPRTAAAPAFTTGWADLELLPSERDLIIAEVDPVAYGEKLCVQWFPTNGVGEIIPAITTYFTPVQRGPFLCRPQYNPPGGSENITGFRFQLE